MGIVNLQIGAFQWTIDFAQVLSARNEFYAHQFWPVVFVQQHVAALVETFGDFPLQQVPASFNVSEVTVSVKAAANSQATPAK